MSANTIQTYAQFFSYTIPVFAACRLHEIYFTFWSKTFFGGYNSADAVNQTNPNNTPWY